MIESIPTSFFDEFGDSKLYDFRNFIIGSVKDLKEILPFKSNVLVEKELLYKKSINSTKPELFFYKLYCDRLECYKEMDSKELIHILLLTGARVKFHKNFFHDSAFKYSISLSKNKRKYIVFFEAEAIYKLWKINLKKFCILDNYEKNYENLEILGQGANSQIFKCQNKKLNSNQFATKTLKKNQIINSQRSDKIRASIIKEVSILRTLNHKNIYKLHYVYEDEKEIHLLLDLLEGGDLYKYILSIKSIPEEEVYNIIFGIVHGLAYLHSLGIMHRDLKPENLIFKKQNSFDIVIADFGLAEYHDKKDWIYKRCGTPGYVAPEILRDQDYNCNVDIFSLGVILFTLYKYLLMKD